MAIFPSQVLRDLIQNNIDFVAKQVGVVNDFLFGPTSTGEDPIEVMPYTLMSNQLIAFGANSAGCEYNWTQYSIANTSIDGAGVSIGCYDCLPSIYGQFNKTYEIMDIAYPVGKSYSMFESMSDMGYDYLYSVDGMMVGHSDANQYDGDAYMDITGFGVLSDQHLKIGLSLNPKQSYSYRGEICDGYNVYSAYTGYSGYFYFQSLSDQNNPSNFILLPNEKSRNVTIQINSPTTQTYNYNGDTVYNYYNDYGDIIINGGSGFNVTPIGGLAFADVKLILDSLIDDLNLHFDFSSDGVAPLDYAPTLDEIRYGDYSDFYIEKLHQYDTLPSAPSFLGELQLEEYPKYLGTATQSLLDLLPGVGLSALCAMCFLVGLITSKIRG